MSRKVLLLVGSPKPGKGTSEALGDYLLEQLQQKGLATEKMKVNEILQAKAGQDKLISAVNSCDVFVLSCPLYVDSAPAAVIKALELVAQARKGREQPKRQVMIAICNSGFPEAHQNNPALSIYRCFAQEAGFNWAGGLALGGGGAIDGQPLTKLGGRVKNVIKSLDTAASALAIGEQIPDQAVKLMAKSFVPSWLYLVVGQFMWKSQAKKYGAHKRLNDRPYQK